jgi:D-3-phosphoglycerate dehydrogenase
MTMGASNKVVFADGPGEASIEEEILVSRGYELVLGSCTSHDEVVELAGNARALLVGLYPIDAKLIDRLPALEVIVRQGVGYDNVDIDAATRAGVIVCNVTDYGIHEVANHAFAMLLALNRKLIPLDRALHAGIAIPPSVMMPHTGRVVGQTLGLVSFGAIAREVATRASGFRMNVIAYDPYVDPALAERAGVRLVALPELLAESDYVSVHTPLSAATRGLIGARELALMKPSAYLVVTSRGGVVDEQALVDALREGRLAGVGLDVWEHEPPDPRHPLLQFENVIGSLHMAFYSEVAVVVLRQRIAEAAADVLDGVMPRAVVNPEVLEHFDLRPRADDLAVSGRGTHG